MWEIVVEVTGRSVVMSGGEGTCAGSRRAS